MENIPTRYISSFIIEFINEFNCFCRDKYNFSTDEIAILCLIASESTRDIRNDAFLSKSYGAENDTLPSGHRPPVTVKYIHTRLGMSRETTRRKLEQLREKKLLQKINGGYVFPAQVGADDYTKELREFLVKGLKALEKYMKKMPQSFDA